MSESVELDAMLEDKRNEDSESNEYMGQLKTKVQKLSKLARRKIDDFSDVTTAKHEHDDMCGVVEGFYGRPWTFEQRKELFGRMQDIGLNTYLYAPKDDYKHRLFWREKYSPDEAELLKGLIDAAAEHDVTFVYAISPGLDMVYGAEKEVNCLKNKLLQVKSLGCKAFAILFDDIDPVLTTSDLDEFESSAHAQSSITNMMFRALDQPRFLFCPTEYCSNMAIPSVSSSTYLRTLGKALHPHISIMWTGPKVVSNVISVESIQLLTSVLQRKVVIWDNIHANDYDPKRVFLGPYKGRSSNLVPHLAGALTNPNCEFEANFIAMHTLATWWKSFKKLDEPNTTSAESNSTEHPVSRESPPPPNPPTTPVRNSPSSVSSSISSGRASDDSDTDSDYSSHDGSIYPRIANFDHGMYNPDEALMLAIHDWLPVFSCVRYPVRKPIPRSGTAPSLPMLPVHPIITKPPSTSTCVTSTVVVEPMISARLSVGSRPQSPFIPEAESKLDPADLASSLESQTNDPKPTTDSSVNDVDMSSSKDPDSVDKDASDKVTTDSSSTGEMSVEITPCPVEAGESLGKDDVEMKESGGEEKSSEVMQTDTNPSPKPLSASLQMETEEAQILMQTDEVDSDVSMATAQSGSVIPLDIDDLGSPYVAPEEEEESKSEEKSKSDNDSSLVTPTMTTEEKSAEVKEEVGVFEPLTVEALHILVQCFYLPYEHGLVGREMVAKFRWLKENAFKLSKIDDKKSEKYLDKALVWSEKALAFEESSRSILKVFNQICACPNRALLFDLFPYLWDMKGVVTMLRSYVKWLGMIEVRPDSEKHDGDKSASSSSPTASIPPFKCGWIGADPEPWVFRGGLSGEFQRLLPVASSFDLFCQTLPLTPEVCTYIVRPYTPTDEAAVFNICYTTHNDGMECSNTFEQHKDLPADKLVGALLTLSPDYCFVVEDEDGLCGYLAACLNAKDFWTKYELAYLPEMREKYDRPSGEGSNMSEVEKMIVDLHSAEDRFNYADSDLSSSYPSMMCIAVKQSTNTSIAKSMTVCLLSALKSHNSCGVHALISEDSIQLLDLYTQLGFSPIVANKALEQDTYKIVGRTF